MRYVVPVLTGRNQLRAMTLPTLGSRPGRKSIRSSCSTFRAATRNGFGATIWQLVIRSTSRANLALALVLAAG